MNTTRLTIYIFLLVIISGCVTSRTDPDLMADWKFCPHNDSFCSNEKVAHDYRAYIETLPLEEQREANDYHIWFFKDSTGRHDVKIKIPLNGTWWEHDPIYNQENERIKVIKHANGRYQS